MIGRDLICRDLIGSLRSQSVNGFGVLRAPIAEYLPSQRLQVSGKPPDGTTGLPLGHNQVTRLVLRIGDTYLVSLLWSGVGGRVGLRLCGSLILCFLLWVGVGRGELPVLYCARCTTTGPARGGRIFRVRCGLSRSRGARAARPQPGRCHATRESAKHFRAARQPLARGSKPLASGQHAVA
jgi:hypothetical protein